MAPSVADLHQRSFHAPSARSKDYKYSTSYADNNCASPKDLGLGNTKTDRTRWRLLNERGRQRWRYLRTKEEAAAWPQSAMDKWAMGMPVDSKTLPKAATPKDSIQNALTFFEQLQLEPGNWACEYGGPMFLLPGLLITWYITSTPIHAEYRIEISNYIFALQNKTDGGWGLHSEGETSVFGTAMNYTTLRLCGVEPDDKRMIRARAKLHEMGGAVMGPHWAKFWLSLLGVCEWDAVNPVPPELWLLPDWVPIAPWRWWIHMRQVFLPMSYIYSVKYSHPLDDLTSSLRQELYTQPYSSIDFASHRNSISPYDNYHPKTSLLNCLNWVLVNIHLPYTRTNSLKTRAEDWTYKLIEMEDENTLFSNLGPVNGPMNTIAAFIRQGADSYPVRRHLDRLHDFLWMSTDGMLMNGTNGVQTWDTALFIQSCVEAGVAQDPRWVPMLTKALEFLEDHQMREECHDQALCYRQSRKGAWGFSTRDQGYTVSDCTAEAVKSVIELQALPEYPKLVSDERIQDAIDILLTMQNASGGFSSYEPTRGSPTLLEALNAAEVFGRIMVEYDYPECTTAVLTALYTFKQHYPSYRAADISAVTQSALRYVRSAQRPDGSWYGSWGICFTYAGMFALTSLAAAGETYENSERVHRACEFLIDKQRDDGGWGESYKSCEDGVWTEHPDGTQIVNTAFALIALIEGRYPHREPLERGIRLIMERQKEDGRWDQESIEGVFNKTCMISFPNYKFIFPIKALGLFAHRYGNEAIA